MELPWQFVTDAKSDAFCREIVAEMVRLFGISAEEAIGRLERLWRGQSILGEEDVVYHETAEYWAHVAYFGKESRWWIMGEKRRQMGLGPVVPRPYP